MEVSVRQRSTFYVPIRLRSENDFKFMMNIVPSLPIITYIFITQPNIENPVLSRQVKKRKIVMKKRQRM